MDGSKAVSSVIHALQRGQKWRDAPTCCDQTKTICGRDVRWDRAGTFARISSKQVADGDGTAIMTVDAKEERPPAWAVEVRAGLLTQRHCGLRVAIARHGAFPVRPIAQ